MRRLAYISSASPDLEAADLEAILKSAIARNHANSVTGSLLYNGLNFMQVLEGESRAITDTYLLIIADKRHSGVVTILDEDTDQRVFADWSMQLSIVPSVAGKPPKGLSPSADFFAAMPKMMPDYLRQLLTGFNSMSQVRFG